MNPAATLDCRANRVRGVRRGLRAAMLAAVAGLAFAQAGLAFVPVFDHVVVVVMENHGYDALIGNADAPYVNALAAQGARFTQAYAVTHPSQPNYLALFSGSTQGVIDDVCPFDFVGVDNLGAQLIAAGKTFAGYSEDMPSVGYSGCLSGHYVRKHNPWVDFDNVPSASNRPFTDFPTDFSTLPDLAFVVPNQCSNTHDCPIATGDAWLQTHVEPYVQWARTHASLLILTWDEDDGGTGNHILTVFAGAFVEAGDYVGVTDHYRVLATLEAMHDLPPLGAAAARVPITAIWSDRIYADGFELPAAMAKARARVR